MKSWSCFVCSQILIKEKSLCSYCRDILFSLPLQRREQGNLNIYSLMLYQGHGKELIKKIKNGKNKALMAELVRNLIQKIPIEELKDLRGVIPTPAKVKGAKDHAYFLGQNISQYVGLPLYDDLLIKAEARESQKQGGIEWRQQVHFKLLREERALSEGVWILADDVITTGLTLLEMHKALGKPRTLCLTLATRPFVL